LFASPKTREYIVAEKIIYIYIYIYRRNFSKIGYNVIIDVHLELQKRGNERRSAQNTEDERERESEREIERGKGPQREEDC